MSRPRRLRVEEVFIEAILIEKSVIVFLERVLGVEEALIFVFLS